MRYPRIGHGYDIHRFQENTQQNHVILGGVKIPYERGLIAHSDGDVVIHALCDALLGACAQGDIGQHFPDTDPCFKNSDSREFLKQVVKKVLEMGYQIGNVDISIIAQAPKMAPHIFAMREHLANDLQVSINDVNIKATTNEGVDAVGQKLAIAVHAVAIIVSKDQ